VIAGGTRVAVSVSLPLVQTPRRWQAGHRADVRSEQALWGKPSPVPEPHQPVPHQALGIDWGGNFLAKHCLGTGNSTGRFERLCRGLYRLKR